MRSTMFRAIAAAHAVVLAKKRGHESAHVTVEIKKRRCAQQQGKAARPGDKPAARGSRP